MQHLDNLMVYLSENTNFGLLNKLQLMITIQIIQRLCEIPAIKMDTNLSVRIQTTVERTRILFIWELLLKDVLKL